MLREALNYVTTPVRHRFARKLGYVYEAIALQARYQRCAYWWQPHYARCQAEILKAASQVEEGGRVLIVGAGLLHDIPLEALLERFERVDLVDLVFLRSARRQIRRLNRRYRRTGGQIRRLEVDVTGQLDKLLQGDLSVEVPSWGWDEGYDLVVSLNLITQLPLLPTRYLLRQGVAEEDVDRFGHDLIEAHLAWLRGFEEARVCLIADQHIDEMDRQGRLVERVDDPWWGVMHPPVQAHWQWEALPLREGRCRRRVHHVGASHWQNRPVLMSTSQSQIGTG